MPGGGGSESPGTLPGPLLQPGVDADGTEFVTPRGVGFARFYGGLALRGARVPPRALRCSESPPTVSAVRARRPPLCAALDGQTSP
ncbi:MAG: hypothetical protein LC799_30080, partial [Actinobacteria bacterium]|nr:hypothetical protein [Actinomycetota bacterium]